MSHRVVLIRGDGIGPEVIDAACRVVAATGVRVEWEEHMVGMPAVERGGEPLGREVVEAIRSAGVGLKGPVTTPADGRFPSVNLGLKRALGLYAQVRPSRTLAGIDTGGPRFDVVVVREATEDLYAGIELDHASADAHELRRWLTDRGFHVPDGAALGIKPVSEQATRRVFEFAFDWARRHGRRLVTSVHKATALPRTDGLWAAVAREVAAANADIRFDERLVDEAAARLARSPGDLDVLVLSNVYGDVISDLAAARAGSVGLASGASYGEGVAVFEPGHGSAPRHAGTNRANPTGVILSAALLLDHLGQTDAAARVVAAVEGVLADGEALTYDVCRSGRTPAGTSEFAAAVVSRLSRAGDE